MNKKQFNINLGNELKKLRHELSLSQEELAEKTNSSRTYIGAIERGEKSISAYKLYEILSIVNFSISEFMDKL